MFKVFLCIGTQHNLWLVGLAAAVCIAATFAAFFLYSKVPAFPAWRRWSWLVMTGVVAGSGIWTTHFVAMLAFKTGLPTGYAGLPTFGSLVIAVVSTTIGFAIGSEGTAQNRRAFNSLLGGVIIGLGITLMHYVGMMGYRTAGRLSWDGSYVLASVLLGVVLATAALQVAHPSSPLWRRFAGSGLLALAIVAMHFTGMTAVTILPDMSVSVPASLISNSAMVAITVGVTAVILITAVGGVAFDSASRNAYLNRLREALDVMPEGLAFYDASDTLVAWNTQYEDLCRAGGAGIHVGMPFSDLLRANLVHGAYPAAVGRETEWLAERTAARSTRTGSLTAETSGGRWLRITDRQTIDGGTVTVSVDITELKRTELALTEARDQAEELAHRAEAAERIAGLGHWRLDAATREVTWSPELYRIYGLPEGEPLDLAGLMAMGHPDDAAASVAQVERQLLSGETCENIVTRIIRRSGDVRYLTGNSRAEQGPDGRIVAIIGTVIDVTDEKAAEIAIAKSEERFRRLAVNAPDIIAESTIEGILTYVSPASLTITGFAPEELIGRSFAAWMHPEDAQKVLEMCQTAFASKGRVAPWPVEFRATHKDGRPLWLECKPTLAIDPATGQFNGLTDVIRDITPRKALEAELRKARAEAETAAAVKADFLANMSHELRTPLTSIIGFTNLAVEQADLPDLARGYVERVRDASRALLCSVNDILDFSKLEAGQVGIHPHPVDVSSFVCEALDLFIPQAGAKHLDLVFDEAPGADGLVVALDPDRIRQILLNFISNAIKFTAEGSVIVKTRYDETAERLTVDVVDTGAGIPQEKLDLLFKRFSQVDGSLTGSQGGTGLGLAICKGLAEAMGGEVGAESHPGQGSRFWFTIPAPRALLETDAEAEPEAPAPCPGIRVLLADDHATNRQLAILFLAGIGAEVTEAVDGEDAVRLAAENPFDVIVLDMRMPRLDGPGALVRIRTTPGPNGLTPVLAFTADVGRDAERRLLELGFQGVVAKPVNPAALIAAVSEAAAQSDILEPSSERLARIG